MTILRDAAETAQHVHCTLYTPSGTVTRRTLWATASPVSRTTNAPERSYYNFLFHFSDFFSLRLRFLLRDCLSFELSVITPSAKQPVKVDQGNTVVALVLRMVQPVEVTAGKFHAIMTSNRSDIGVKLGVQMVERMRLEEKREES
jgi:hypothetical protein